MHRGRYGCPGAFLLVAVCAWAGAAAAAPWRPVDDGQLLETLDRATSATALQQASSAAERRDLNVVSQLVRAYVERSRREGDPRLLGYAEGLLQHWDAVERTPPEILLLRATVLQSRHAFDAALDELDQALQQQPDLAQAWLTRATILRVQGRYAEAAQACDQLRGRASGFVEALCRVGVRSLSGELQASLADLRALQHDAATQPPGVRSWYQAELADALERAGRVADAEAAYRVGLEIDAQDVPLRAAYADLLIDQARYADALALTDGYSRVDVLRLRHLIAQVRLGRASSQDIDALQEAFALAQLRGQPLHQREEVLFALDVRADAQRAFAVARANWRVQREPVDARVLLRAALASGDAAVAQQVAAMVKAMPLEDARLKALLAAGTR